MDISRPTQNRDGFRNFIVRICASASQTLCPFGLQAFCSLHMADTYSPITDTRSLITVKSGLVTDTFGLESRERECIELEELRRQEVKAPQPGKGIHHHVGQVSARQVENLPWQQTPAIDEDTQRSGSWGSLGAQAETEPTSAAVGHTDVYFRLFDCRTRCGLVHHRTRWFTETSRTLCIH
jgi:hypothetical protein